MAYITFLRMKSSLFLPIAFSLMFNFGDYTKAKKIYVSLRGSSTSTCGSLRLPCRYVKETLEKSSDNDVIMIDGTFWGRPAEFDEDKITISKSVQIIGYDGQPALRFKGKGTFITVQPDNTTFQKNISQVLFENVKFMAKDKRTSILSVSEGFIAVSKSEFSGGNNSLQIECKLSCQLSIEGCIFVDMVTGIRVSGGCKVSIDNTVFKGKLWYSQHAIMLAKHRLQSRELIDRIKVTRSLFQYFFSSAIAVNNTIGGEMNFNITHCMFRNNFAFNSRQAPAISISFYNSSLNTTNVSIIRSSFVDNTGYYGGTVYINSSAPLFLNITHCFFEANRAYIAGGAIYAYVRNSIYVTESRFIKNTCKLFGENPFLGAGHGGAIVLSGDKDSTYKTVVSNCHFIENTATGMGGTLYSSLRSSEVQLSNVVFESCEQQKNRAADGDVVFILSKVKMWNTTVRIKNPVNERNVFYVHNDDISIDMNSSFICAKGYRVAIMNIQYTPHSGDFSLFSMLCRTCPYSHYSVVESSYQELGIQNPPCFPCSSNSVCRRGISKPKDNFWGYQVNSSAPITYMQLPMRYGCTGLECKRFNSCAANREDVMCARCAKGYSEHVLANGCISNKYCNRIEFWLLATTAVVLYIVLFLYKSEIFSLCKRNVNWLCSFRQCGKPGNDDVVYEDVYVRIEDAAAMKDDSGNSQDSCTPRSTRDREFGSGLLKIVFYFYQIEIILHEDIGNKDDTIFKQMLRVPLSFFNFDFLATYNSKLCAFTNTTPVKKVFFRIALITIVFLGLGIIIMIARLLQNLNQENVASRMRKLGDKALSASFEIFVLVYGVNVMAGLKLLNCVSYKDEQRLLIQGNIKCYSIWQYAVMFVMILWALPYCIFIFLLPKWLQRQETNKLGILFGCLFPLPFLMRRLYTWRLSSPFDIIVDKLDDPVVHRILESLIAPFRKSKKRHEFLWWEGVYIFRRLLIISLVRFVHDPFAKNQLMLFAQVLFLLHHMYCRPFNLRFLNHIETASLTILVTFTSTSALYAYNYKYGISGNDTSTLSDVFAWLRVFVIIALPCIAVALFIIPFILLFIRNITKLIIMLVSHIKCYSRTV